MENGVIAQRSTNSSGFTVGVLIDSVNGYFNHRAIGDLIEAAEERNIHLVFYFGGFIEKDKTCGDSSYAYTLPDPEIIDALIVFPHSIAPFSPQSATLAILEQYPLIPVYSLFCDLPGKFSVLINDISAIEDMVRHLVQDHSYRKFALLCGPDSPESVSHERQTLISTLLSGFSLDIESKMVYSGDLTMESGKKAASKILEKADTIPEILICMNDQMAIGAVKEFLNYGISVPEDIAVVGFDDVEENNTLPTRFSTISIPVWDMISTLLGRIASDLSGTTSPSGEKIWFKARFVHRESCGCTSWIEDDSRQTGTVFPFEEQHLSRMNLKRMAELRHTLEEVLEDCLATQNTARFNDFFQQTIRTLSRSGDLTSSFIDLFSTQWTITLLRHKEFESQVLVNTLFVDAFRMFVQSKMQSFASSHDNDLGTLAFTQNCSALISQNLSVYDAVNIIASNLPLLGIEHCFMIFLSPEDPNIGQLQLAYRQGKPVEIPQALYPTFPAKQLVHDKITSYLMPLAVLPLVYANTVYGYLIFSMTNERYEHFPRVQNIVSRIIDSAMANDRILSRIQTLTRTNDALSRLSSIDEFTGLHNRRALYLTGQAMYQQASLKGETCCFIFLDMDGLKTINDKFGHMHGDKAIKALSNILKRCFREIDLVVRYGGDEFVVLMVNIHEEALQGALLRISEQLQVFNDQKAYPWILSVSWGYTLIEPKKEPKSFESIIEESDAKLYEQKRLKKASGASGML